MLKYKRIDENDVIIFLTMVNTFLRPNLMKQKATFNFKGKNYEMRWETPEYPIVSMEGLISIIKSGFIECLLFKNIETGNLMINLVTLEQGDHADLGEILEEISG